MKKLFVALQSMLAGRVVQVCRSGAGTFSLRRLLPIKAAAAHALVLGSNHELSPEHSSGEVSSEASCASKPVARKVRPAFMEGFQLNGGIILGAN